MLSNKNSDLQWLLDESNKLLKLQKECTEKEIVEKEELKKELDFWLPGYQFFKEDNYLRKLVTKNPPQRIYDEFTKTLDDSQFALYGDGQRLASSVAVKSLYQHKYEKVQHEKEDLWARLEEMKESETFYIKEMNYLKNEVKELRQKQDNILLHKNLEKIVELENEIESLKDSHSHKIEDILNSKPKMVSIELQTDKENQPLSLLYPPNRYNRENTKNLHFTPKEKVRNSSPQFK